VQGGRLPFHDLQIWNGVVRKFYSVNFGPILEKNFDFKTILRYSLRKSLILTIPCLKHFQSNLHLERRDEPIGPAPVKERVNAAYFA
jgi:hypothetical protein